MNVFFNNIPTELPATCKTLEDLAFLKQIPRQGSAIAVNDTLIKHDKWGSILLKENDQVVVITAAFGG